MSRCQAAATSRPRSTCGFHIHGFQTYAAATVIIWAVNLVFDVTPGPWQLTGKRGRVRLRQRSIGG